MARYTVFGDGCKDAMNHTVDIASTTETKASKLKTKHSATKQALVESKTEVQRHWGIEKDHDYWRRQPVRRKMLLWWSRKMSECELFLLNSA